MFRVTMKYLVAPCLLGMSAYLAVVLTFAYFYELNGVKSPESLLFSFDTFACRGRMPEPENMTVRWLSCAEAVIGHIAPGFVIGVILMLFQLGIGEQLERSDD